MNLLPFNELPPYRARRFVPAKSDFGDWSQIQPLFDWLEGRMERIASVVELEEWVVDWGELSAALDEESSRRYIAMTCHTENKEAEAAYLHFVEKIEPELKPRQFKLSQLYLGCSVRKLLNPKRYEVFDRETALRVEIFREENVPLETEEARLGNEYQKITGSLTVQFRGEERTLVAMGRFQEDNDRTLREEAWRAVAARRAQEVEKLDDLFDRMVDVRQKIARNAGFSNYRDYAFRARGRFDYTAADCERFHAAIESEVMPVMRQLQRERRAQLGLDALRPWDLSVDPLGRAPLRPFQTSADLEERCQQIFHDLDRDLEGDFVRMRRLRLLDLDNRKGKAPGGYQSTLAEARLPFIFMNSVGLQRDVETLLHEAGHAFHALASREEDLYAYRGAPIEFCEVASMAMELLGADFFEKFYSPADAARARRVHLEGIVGVFPWIATVDAFQHWIYTHPGHARTERRAAWMGLMDRFGGDVDWSGLERSRESLWQKQLHIYLYPFYYVEYGIAQLGALQVWRNYRGDSARAIQAYKKGLGLGGSRPLPELFESSGCRFDFSQATMKPLLEQVRVELSRLAPG